MPWTLRTQSADAVVSHGNIAPWHVVFEHEHPADLIGWEYAGPVDPLDQIPVTA